MYSIGIFIRASTTTNVPSVWIIQLESVSYMERLARSVFLTQPSLPRKSCNTIMLQLARHNICSLVTFPLQSGGFWQEPIFCSKRGDWSSQWSKKSVVVFSLQQPTAGDIAYTYTARACCDIYPLDNLFDQRVNALWTDLRATIIRRTPHSGGHRTTSRELFMAAGWHLVRQSW